jgi:hypothetical protein
VSRSVDKGGFGGLEVAFWPLVPKFAGSNPINETDDRIIALMFLVILLL